MTSLQQFIEVSCNLRWILLNYEPLITRVIRDSSKWPNLCCWWDGAKPMWLAAYETSVWVVVLPLRCYHRNPVYIINLQPAVHESGQWGCIFNSMGRSNLWCRGTWGAGVFWETFQPHVWQVLAAYLNTGWLWLFHYMHCFYPLYLHIFLNYYIFQCKFHGLISFSYKQVWKWKYFIHKL